MGKKQNITLVLLSAVIFTALFHKQTLGLNLLIFELLIFTWFLLTKQFHFNSKNSITIGFAVLISAFATIIVHSKFSYFINIVAMLAFIGILIYPQAKSLLFIYALSFANLINSQIKFLSDLSNSEINGNSVWSAVWKSRIFVVPLFIIFLFILIYRNSNPVFDKLLIKISLFIQKQFNFVFSDFDFLILFTFLIGILISVFVFIQTEDKNLSKIDQELDENLHRKRTKNYRYFNAIALAQEYKSAIFLFSILNLILLIVNGIDVKWVWLNFEWQGQYLKQFVHEGTYLLILSVLISIGLVLFYFRNNLNFYQNNKLLKYLAFLWLAQNVILCISVAIRNFWYIHYFALAYKRIGVIIFLVLTIYLLYTVFIKVRGQKSAFYLLRSNLYALFVCLVTVSVVNWDSLIAKYNFRNARNSFLHLNYLATLSDKALPYLDKSYSELLQINEVQKKKFPFEQKYMTPKEYYVLISFRKIMFQKRWKSKGFLSWNLAEHLAYQDMFYNTNK